MNQYLSDVNSNFVAFTSIYTENVRQYIEEICEQKIDVEYHTVIDSLIVIYFNDDTLSKAKIFSSIAEKWDIYKIYAENDIILLHIIRSHDGLRKKRIAYKLRWVVDTYPMAGSTREGMLQEVLSDIVEIKNLTMDPVTPTLMMTHLSGYYKYQVCLYMCTKSADTVALQNIFVKLLPIMYTVMYYSYYDEKYVKIISYDTRIYEYFKKYMSRLTSILSMKILDDEEDTRAAMGQLGEQIYRGTTGHYVNDELHQNTLWAEKLLMYYNSNIDEDIFQMVYTADHELPLIRLNSEVHLGTYSNFTIISFKGLNSFSVYHERVHTKLIDGGATLLYDRTDSELLSRLGSPINMFINFTTISFRLTDDIFVKYVKSAKVYPDNASIYDIRIAVCNKIARNESYIYT
jgi:hypothetical protein